MAKPNNYVSNILNKLDFFWFTSSYWSANAKKYLMFLQLTASRKDWKKFGSVVPLLIDNKQLQSQNSQKLDFCSYSRTPIIRTPIIRNAYYPNATLIKEIKTWQEALERQLRFKRKMRPKIKNHLTRARRAVFTVISRYIALHLSRLRCFAEFFTVLFLQWILIGSGALLLSRSEKSWKKWKKLIYTLIFLFLKHILGLKRGFVFCFMLRYSIAL